MKRNCLDSNDKANGELYYDDGVSIVPNDDLSQHNYYHFLFNFNADSNSASLNITRTRAAVRPIILRKTIVLDQSGTQNTRQYRNSGVWIQSKSEFRSIKWQPNQYHVKLQSVYENLEHNSYWNDRFK